MLSETFYKLWNAGILQRGIWETIYMTVISTAISASPSSSSPTR